MKKTLLLVTLLLIMSTMLAQSVTVRFTARSTNGQYHPFESVRVENETQGWSQRIDYPDTIIVLGTSESIDVAEAIKGPQIKVYPNPFAGRTSTELQICEDGEATVSIMRINGSVVSEYNGFMKAGIYRLNVSLAEPQVAFLCVSTRSGRTVAKMVNTATGTADKIDISYLEGYSSQTKAVGIGPFNVGDQMSYNANYTSSNGITTSNTVTKTQTTSELITLVFTESSSTTLPTVTTSTVSNTTSSTATCGGNVTNDGNATVTARGVCWSTSHNPTVSDSHTTDGSGTGSFTSSITGLSENTTYYVRAYATNSVGTAYGNEVSFTTNTPSVGGFDENGASTAVFTVASGRTVHFSKGNLQYRASTGTWRFAEHQYDFIGADNANISSTYSGWIDLFGWGTSGWNSGANAYQPWATSTSYVDYYPGGSYTNSLTGEYANADWGVYNAISNGGNQAGMWRTLTNDEWEYLLFSRAASTACGYGDVRYVKATVNNVTGLIIFPDTYTHPSGVATLHNVNTTSATFSGYAVTLSEWQQIEAAGAIFLPSACSRAGTGMYNVGTAGYYWSSTCPSTYGYESSAYYMFFGDEGIDVYSCNRVFGNSVRLVFTESSSTTTTLPTVTTSTVSNTTSSTATCGGNVTNDGNATVTARGVCWSTSHNPTVSNSHTTDGSGTGSFTSSITGLSENTTYYVRAYATNSVGTAYGNEVSFTIQIVGGFDQNGASNAVFTVASGSAVHFSRGNLQYQASTGIWRFAENQWDFVGDDNSNISSSYSVWIDLFGWGTSGWNSGANAYQPWATSTTNSDYRPGSSGINNLTGDYANADWGVYNAISNGGNQAGMWRTLTKAEWEYLLKSRAASTINGVANARYAKAVVNGTNGLVIFPDIFTMPSGMIYPSGINTSAPFNNNTYTESQWSQMEGAGCIFLPAAGYRDGTVVGWAGSYGEYWSSSYIDQIYAYYVEFSSGDVDIYGNDRHMGRSVRLVRDTTSTNVSLLTVTTSSVSSITLSTATCGGNVTNDGNATVTARGVCWSTSHNPTVSNSHTTDGSGTGSFTSSMTGLAENTTYYVRAYATNSVGTAYGNEVSFTTNTPSVGGFDENGASNAVFTVASGRTVKFSRGNLQYQASTGTWRFAEHQYDYVGADNANISSAYSGWIDLFGWGTSGWSSGTNAYQPWATSTTSFDYRPGRSYNNNLTGSYANADWGVYNAISNGGNQAGMWRTLTKAEWEYLLNSRAASTINGEANARYARAVVNGKNGLVIFPDNFTMPSGMSYPSGINTGAPFNNNTYTESEWSQMEGAGCIFLPAAGLRVGTDVDDVGTCGYYWSSSCVGANEIYAYRMYFYSGSVNVYDDVRYYGRSVRLVRD